VREAIEEEGSISFKPLFGANWETLSQSIAAHNQAMSQFTF